MGAMAQEVGLLPQDIQAGSDEHIGGRRYHTGDLYGSETVVMCSGPGKVSSATTATTLIEYFGVDAILFAGLAGAAACDLEIGDIVIASELVQHDLIEARPLFERFAVPLLPVSRIKADDRLAEAAVKASSEFIDGGLVGEVGPETLGRFGVKRPKVVTGLVAGGDRFVAGAAESERIRALLPDIKCFEMEGAAVAQVCAEHGVPFAVIRAISDRADHSAEVDFAAFATLVGSHYIRGVLRVLLPMVASVR